MKVLLINQNPVIKKLVGMASKKLNLEIENVARIAPDFNPKQYICIIVDDENVGKNLEKLTALQDQVKVCLLFARKTQIKKHEFNIAIQKPFLPTDILEILNECIPKEGEAKSSNTESMDDYGADSINEIDMDLKSAEITPPDGIDLNTAKLQKEAQEIANEDTDDMLDFDPDSLDFSNLEKAGEVALDESQDENDTLDTNINAKDDSAQSTINERMDTPSEKEAQDSNNTESLDDTEEHKVGSLFDSDLSDLKPSGSPLDLANFDLDSIVDSSALKAASLGVAIDNEAKEAADTLGDDDDDLFLSDDERDLLQPSPKKFLQAKEEEARKEKELEEEEKPQKEVEDNQKDEAVQGDSIKEEMGLEMDSEDLHHNSIQNVSLEESVEQKDQMQADIFTEEKQKEVQQSDGNVEQNAEMNKDFNDVSLDTIELESLANEENNEVTSSTKDAILQDESMLDTQEEQADIAQTQLDNMDIANDLDIALNTQDTSTKITGTLDDVFDDLTAALNSAFDSIEPQEAPTDEIAMQDSIPQDNLETQDETILPKEQKEEIADDILADDLFGERATHSNNEDTQATDISQLIPQDDTSEIQEHILETKTIEPSNLEIDIPQQQNSSLEEDENANIEAADPQDGEQDIFGDLGLDDLENLEMTENSTQDLEQDSDTQDEESILQADTLLDSALQENALSLEEDIMQTEEADNMQDDKQEEEIKAQPTILEQDTLAEINDVLLAMDEEIGNTQENTEEVEEIKPNIGESDRNKTTIDSLSMDAPAKDIENNANDDALLTDLLDMPFDSDILHDEEKNMDANIHDENIAFDDLQHDLNNELTVGLDENTMHSLEAMDTLLQDKDSKTQENMQEIATIQPEEDATMPSQSELDFMESLDILQTEDTEKTTIEDNDAQANALPGDGDLLYVALPSNEENIENLTETELAEALGEGDETIVRLNQAFEDTDKQIQSHAMKEETVENNIEMLPEDDISMSLESANNAESNDTKLAEEKTQVVSAKDVKEMDADLLIDFFKNTSKEKLHEIFDGSEINFSIHFGKNEK